MLDVALSRPWLAGRNSNVVISTHFFASVPKHQNSTGSYCLAQKRKRDRWRQRAKPPCIHDSAEGRIGWMVQRSSSRNEHGIAGTLAHQGQEIAVVSCGIRCQ